MVTNTDGTLVVDISADHIAVVPLPGLAAVVLALGIGVWWLLAIFQKSNPD